MCRVQIIGLLQLWMKFWRNIEPLESLVCTVTHSSWQFLRKKTIHKSLETLEVADVSKKIVNIMSKVVHYEFNN